MNTAQVKEKLKAREQELLGEMRRLGEDAREAQETEVEDPIDRVESSENKAVNFRVNTMASESLSQVQAALQRIGDGTYGKCVDCGRQIKESRLEALPWTPYCLEDSEKHERTQGSPMISSE